MTKGYVLVEGHGEVEAVGNLVNRLWQDAGNVTPWAPPRRWKNLHLATGLRQAAERIRLEADAGALLVLRDEDDACPREKAPALARVLAELDLPFPVALVLLHPEYEVLFLPCLPELAGRPLKGDTGERPGLVEGTTWDGASWEARRGIKEWLGQHFPPNRSYKPTTDQLPLTRMLDLQKVREAGVPCFGTLERALAHLAAHWAAPHHVYPPPTAATPGRTA